MASPWESLDLWGNECVDDDVAIFELYALLGDGHAVAAALGLWAMLFLAAAVAFARAALGPREGGIFRM